MCPECRKAITVPQNGVQAFPHNRYLDNTLMMRNSHCCTKHHLPLQLFCDEDACQILICSSCVAVNHQGHDVADIPVRAKETLKYMAGIKADVRKASCTRAAQLIELNAVENKLKELALNNMEKIDEAKIAADKHLDVVRKDLAERAEKHRKKVLTVQYENIQKIRDTEEKIKHSKAKYDAFYTDVDAFVKSASLHDLLAKEGSYQREFADLKSRDIPNQEAQTSFTQHTFRFNPQCKSQINLGDTAVQSVPFEFEMPLIAVRQVPVSVPRKVACVIQ